MKIKAIHTILLIIVIVLGACTERLDVELDSSPPRLIVNGCITSDTIAHEIELTTTSDFFTGVAPPVVNNATVTIETNGVVITLVEKDSTGIYQTPANYFGIPGQTYILTITDVDINDDGENETYTASSFLPSVPNLDAVQVTEFELYGVKVKQVLIFAQDPPEEKNNYMFKIYINDTLISDTLDEVIIQDDLLFNGAYLPGIPIDMLADSMSSPTDTFVNTTETVRVGDIVSVEMSGINDEYYQYMVEAITTSYGTSPFSGPPANPISNIIGDEVAFGFFTTYSISRSYTVYFELPPFKKE